MYTCSSSVNATLQRIRVKRKPRETSEARFKCFTEMAGKSFIIHSVLTPIHHGGGCFSLFDRVILQFELCSTLIIINCPLSMASASERLRSQPGEHAGTTLEEALQSNLALQAAVVTELEQLAQKKADNRRTAARLSQELSRTWQQLDAASAPPVPKNSYRQWKLNFFIGKDRSKPEPNLDVVRRRMLENQTFLHHLQPPWSAKETKALEAVVKEVESTTASSTAETDYTRVAELLNERLGRPADSILKPRTPLECKILYTHTQRKVLPFSKEESRNIFEKVHLRDGYPDWQAIAASLPNDRTAWECLVAYQTKLCPAVQQQAWTPAEDQLLLMYVAAAGPQFVIDGDAMVHFAPRLLPGRSRKQILARVNQCILNPNLHRDAWSEEEERRLAICMKVYCDTPNDLYRVAAHLPHRANKSVVEKWQRSLNPEHSSRPFTKQEDQALVAAARANPEQGWTELTRRFFPDRHPQRIAARWSEHASDQDILARSGKGIVNKRAKRGLAVNDDQDARLNLDDCVVQVQKKPRSR
jgi:hypothetical protein